METRRLRPGDVSREWSEIPDRLCPLHGLPGLYRTLRKPQHAQAVFFDEKTSLEKALPTRTGRGTPVGSGIQGVPSGPLGEAAQRRPVVDRKAGLHRTLPLRFPPAESPVSSRVQ